MLQEKGEILELVTKKNVFMQTIPKIQWMLQAALLALAFCSNPLKARAGATYALRPVIPLKGTARVVQSTGLPSYSYDGVAWETIVDGQILRPGVHVKAEAGSSTIIYLEEQSTLLRLSTPLEWRLSSAADASTATPSAVVRTTPLGFRVRAVHGLAEIREENGGWRLIRVNELIPGGKSVRTSADATLDLYNRTTALFLRVGPKSSLHLISHSDTTSTSASCFRLESGSVQARAQDPKSLVLKD